MYLVLAVVAALVASTYVWRAPLLVVSLGVADRIDASYADAIHGCGDLVEGYHDLLRDCSWELQKLDDFNEIQRLSPYWGAVLNTLPRSEIRLSPVCKIIPPRFRVHALSPFGLLRVVLSYMVYGLYAMISLSLLTLSAASFLIYRFLKRHRPIRMRSPIVPVSSGELKSLFEKFVKEHPLRVTPNTGHKTLAYVRKALEDFSLEFMFRINQKVRDIGGSPKRHAKYGKRLHICFPNLTTSDHDKIRGVMKNRVFEHKGQDCTEPQSPAIMSYVDFHLTTPELGDTITAPTIIITHDFNEYIGHNNWFDGEAEVIVTDHVLMKTRGGDVYDHAFHVWRDEGIIFGTKSVAHYYRIGDYGNSSVFYAYPADGDFKPSDPSCLRTVEKVYAYPLGDHIVATQTDDTYVFTRGGRKLGSAPVGSIVRSAVTMSLAPRGDTYAPNLTSLVRGRFNADKLDLVVLPCAIELTAKISDDLALRYGHKFHHLPLNVVGMTWYNRIMYRLAIHAMDVLPDMFARFPAAVWDKLVGKRAAEALMPWAWHEFTTPNYEVHATSDPRLTSGEVSSHPRINQTPFRSAEPGSAARPADDEFRSTPQRTRKSVRFSQPESSRQSNVHASTPWGSTNRFALLAGPSNPRCSTSPPVAGPSSRRGQWDRNPAPMAPKPSNIACGTNASRVVATNRAGCSRAIFDDIDVTLSEVKTVTLPPTLLFEVVASRGERVGDPIETPTSGRVGVAVSAEQAEAAN
jgi:hypothetical protein